MSGKIYDRPIYAPREVDELFKHGEKMVGKMDGPKTNPFLEAVRDAFGYTDTDDSDEMFEYNQEELIRRLGKLIASDFSHHKTLTKETKELIKVLAFFSLNNRFSTLIENRKVLLGIVDLLKSNAQDFDWIYLFFTKDFSFHQLRKLQEAALGRETLGKDMDLESKVIVLNKIIQVLNGHGLELKQGEDFTQLLDEDGMSSFLSLDNCVREAVCWRELEQSRSHNKDLARLAGAIAWRHWLFKEPLIKQFCIKTDIEYAGLSFKQKAKLLEKAMKHFSKNEVATILDDAIATEFDKRKKTLQPEVRDKLIDKRVSIGVEMEIGEPPFEQAIMYAWLENLDRNHRGDKLTHSKNLAHNFWQLCEYKDVQRSLKEVGIRLFQIRGVLRQLEQEDLSESTHLQIRQKIAIFIESIPEQSLRLKFSDFFVATKVVDVRFVQLIQRYWESKLIETKASVAREKNKLYSFLNSAKKDHAYKSQTTLEELPDDLPSTAHKLLDLFVRHMSHTQSLGHDFDNDSYGEYAFAYTSGNFVDPYRVNLRENWELAKNALHDLDIMDRPIHVTLGWQEDSNQRDIKIGYNDIQKEASILNFALFASAWTNSGFIRSFKEEIESNLKENGESDIEIDSYEDTGKTDFINPRDLGKDYIGVELRGFSLSGGVNQARLFNALGDLGTAMKSYMFVESENRKSSNYFSKLFGRRNNRVDGVDKKLHKIWKKFRTTIEELYAGCEKFPPLYDADKWLDEDNLGKVNNFYREIALGLDKGDSLVAKIRALIIATNKEVQAIFQ